MATSFMSIPQWLLETVLMILLAATMFHALRLERALGMLRRDRAALEDLVRGFNDSTRQAEDGIERLRSAADGAGRQIARHVDQAKLLKSDLEFLTARGEKLCDLIEEKCRAQKPEAPVADPAMRLHAGASASEPDAKPRSQAEKDLLRALRQAR